MIYYRIWVDCNIRMRSQPSRKWDWKLYSIISMTFAMSMNMMLLDAILERNVFHSNILAENIIDLPDSNWSQFLNCLLVFVFPPFILNYMLIFRGDRFEVLTKRYRSYNGRLFATYFIISLSLPIILLFFAALFSRI